MPGARLINILHCVLGEKTSSRQLRSGGAIKRPPRALIGNPLADTRDVTRRFLGARFRAALRRRGLARNFGLVSRRRLVDPGGAGFLCGARGLVRGSTGFNRRDLKSIAVDFITLRNLRSACKFFNDFSVNR